MNVKEITKIGKILGEVLAIVPEDGVPAEGEHVKACVQVDINFPLRRGVMAKTNAGSTRWINFFYEKQPHKICPNCYILNHNKDVCKAAADYLTKAHAKPHYFGELNIGATKQTVIARDGEQIPAVIQKKNTKGKVFVSPKDGYVIGSTYITRGDNEDDFLEERLGKRQRSENPDIHVFEHENVADKLVKSQTTNIITARELQTGSTVGAKGIDNNFTKQQFQNLVKTQSPDFIFLCETKIDKSRMISIAQSILYLNYTCIDRVGIAGGLILMWKDGIYVEIIGCENNMIHGSTYSEPKKIQWNFLDEFSNDVQKPWLVIGDLNFHLDKNNNTSDKWIQTKVNDAGLLDIVFDGRDYTWTSNSYETGSRKARLDMALSNNDWGLNFPSAKLLHLNFIASDHCHVLLITDPIPKHLWRPFKFFRTWLGHNGFKDQLDNAWNLDFQGSPAHQLKQKQHSGRITLSQWNKMEFGDIHKNIKNLQDSLETVQNEAFSDTQHDRIKFFTNELEKWYKIQSELYREKSRDKTGLDMDNNTIFFHTMVNKRMHSNTINVLCDSDGNWLKDRTNISNLLTSHFRKVASTSNPVFTNNVFDVIPKIITESDNAILNVIPTDSEIESVVKSMPAWSSPGPDGFQADFYQSQWQLVGKDIIEVVKKFFQCGHMPRSLNKTYISLIPKCREIHDNIIITHEMIHSMKHKEGYSGTMALKLDLSKAFDRLEWNFLNEILLKFGFSTDFCNFIMQCVTTTSISVLLNDDVLIFGQADMQHVNEILKLLQNFGTLSGQMLNFDKSCVYFIHNLNLEYCEFLAGALQMSIVTDSEKYLGAPLLLRHSKLKSFDPIVQSFEARLKNYVSITLNKSGRSTLIKSVLNSLPTYQMTCFKIPTTLLSKLDSLQLNFWWGHKTGKGIKFVAWDSINQAKELGGLGFRNLETFNTALICKTKIWLDSWVIGLDHPPIPVERLVNTVSYTYVSDLFIENTRF
ncbi:uncharacterized protein LOC113305823 [Papaver somniferum]|uniref:uncharacterized protein LOC113305823 n=1 Tax=Papaver somniferum TaxID=3469 RepID=UPI000E6F9BD3|nr:uncharacterized protein LOC113305823 [Papaver somniferum]